jgi:iron complex outermembrane receptor protein
MDRSISASSAAFEPPRKSAWIEMLVGGLSLLAITGSPAVFGQAAVSEVDEVVVTGSRIRGVQAVGSSVVSLDETDMAKLGLSATADLLRTVPSVLNLGNDPTHTNANQRGNANSSYATGINLRGVGTADTLILVNGHRIAPSGIFATTTDPNAIPQLAVQRIEITADGASAIYGSDAVAGVVNVLLRKPFDGAEATARYGGTSGGKDYQVGALGGKQWELGDSNSGGLMIAVQHNYQDRLKQSDFSNTYTDNYSAHGIPFGSVGGATTGTGTLTPGTLVVGSTFYPLPPRLTTTNFADAGLVASTANTNLHSFYYGGVDAFPELTRNSLVTTAEQNLFDSRVKLHADANYSKQTFDQIQSAGSSNIRSISIPASNPFYLTGVPGLATGANETLAYSTLIDFGPVHNSGYETVYNASVGATIAFANRWQVEPSFDYMTNENVRLRTGLVNNCAFSSAPGTKALNGQICTGTSALFDTNPLTAFNPFAPGTTNPATIDRIQGYTNDVVDYDRSAVNLRADGPLFGIPGGTVRAALGASYTRDALSHLQQQTQGAFTESNSGAFSLFEKSRRNNKAEYAELYVPVVGEQNKTPGVKALAISLAVRSEKYSDFGSTTNPKFGVKWAPGDDLSLHASYGTSFRAPSLAEISPGIGGSGVYLVGGAGPGTVLVLGGQVGLRPEEAKSWSFGADYVPGGLDGDLVMSLNYFNLKVDNQIYAPPVPSILNDAAYARFRITRVVGSPLDVLVCGPAGGPAPALLQAPSCGGATTFIDNRVTNSGSSKTNGLEFSNNYKWNSRVGKWNVGTVAQYVDTYDLQGTTGGRVLHNVNTVNSPLRFSGRLILGWEKGGYSATTYVNYVNSYTNRLVKPTQNVSSFTTADLTLSYDTGMKLRLGFSSSVVTSLRVTNLFNSTPPYVRNFSGSTTVQSYAFDPEVANGFGRSMYIQISAKL